MAHRARSASAMRSRVMNQPSRSHFTHEALSAVGYPSGPEPPTVTPAVPRGDKEQAIKSGLGGHRLMMLVCCMPVVAGAVLLVATGVAGRGAIIAALACLVMMAMMVFAIPGGHNHK